MARAARGTAGRRARPVTGGARTDIRRRSRRGPRFRRRQPQQTAVVGNVHVTRAAMKSLAPYKPTQTGLDILPSRCLLSVCDLAAFDVAVRDLDPRIFSMAISVCLACGCAALRRLAWCLGRITAQIGIISGARAPACARAVCSLSDTMRRQDLPVLFINPRNQRQHAALPTLFAALAARSSVYLRTQPDAALLLTH
jgi:hypothetical protein